MEFLYGKRIVMLGLMETSMKGNGWTGNKMEKEFIQTRMEKKEKEFGKLENE